MARERKTIPLKRPIDGPKGRIAAVVLQEPASADYWILGDPRTWVKAKGGMALVDNDEVIRAYTERMIIEPDPLLAMNNLSILDAMAVKNGVLSFFEDATPTP
ncbi:hypothetical protein [Bradyrhizobium sp. HKCCYLR20261]|uniref:hypothetical protein n=1 Tax=Bradyrhizobium sp. HKCCYLR20261 TaxID=3420760 RepID=UPI003EBC7B98